MDGWSFGVLGDLTVAGSGGVGLVVRGQRRRALLVRLLVARSAPLASGVLIDDVWDGAAPAGAASTLQSHVSLLRRELGGRLRSAPGGYRLVVADEEFDVACFEADARQGQQAVRSGDVSGAIDVFGRALSWWRGEALVDVAGAGWAAGEIARLAELRASVLEGWFDARLAVGGDDRLAGDLEATLVADPLRERLWGQLMLALYRSGRQSDALRAFQRLRRVLGDELGIAPSTELVALDEAIVLQKPHLDWQPPLALTLPAVRTSGARAQNLPLQLTSFIGRETDVVELVATVRTHRLVTLTAAGGSGKTRLAVHAAAELVDDFVGVFLVELAPVADAGMVGVRLLEAIGIPAPTDSPQVDSTLVERVGDRQLLVVIDNCEHLIAECARLVVLLLTRCPNLHVLTTTREVLAVPGEHVVTVNPLAVPATDAGVDATISSPAVALFVDRAQARDARFAVTAANAAAVRDVCRCLDGIPLALELAAARVHALSVEDLAARLDDAIHVMGGVRTSDARHRTLISCLDWSYQLLDAGEATLLHRLAVFAGGCTLDAAEVVCAGAPVSTVHDSIARLVDKSLVIADRRQSRVRYRLLEVVRQYALEHLAAAGEAEDIRSRHLDWYVEMVRTSAPRLSGADVHVVQLLLAEADNLTAAIAYALRTNATVALVRLLGGGGHMWAHARMMGQLAGWWHQVLPLLPETPDPSFPPNRLASSLASAGAALMNVRDFDGARRCFDRSRSISGASAGAVSIVAFLASSLEGLAGAPPDEVISLAESLLPQMVEVPLTLGSALAQWLLLTHQPGRARELLDDLLLAQHGVADTTSWVAFARCLRGLADVLEGRVDTGLLQIDEVRHEVTSIEENWLFPQICWVHGLALVLAGRDHDAVTVARDALIASRDWGITWGLPYAVELGALAIDRLGYHELAARCLGSVDATYREAGGRPPSGHPGTFLHNWRIAADLDPEDVARGEQLTIALAADELLDGLSSSSTVPNSVERS